MGLSSALNTALNGLALNETIINTLGNNIANAGTNGFKASSVRFQTQLSETLSIGSAPSGTNGGTNPQQIGLGASVASIFTNFTQGNVADTTSSSDLAIQGDGFFVVNGADGPQYTRNGNFSRNSNSLLVNDQGATVQGYQVDSNYVIQNTTISDISIPLGSKEIAQKTSQVKISGALYSSGVVATQGTNISGDALVDTSTSAAATASTLLTNLKNGANSLGILSGDTLTFSPHIAGRTIPPVAIAVTATTTYGDLAKAIQNRLGIPDSSVTPSIPNNGRSTNQTQTPGVTINGTGQLQVVGLAGTADEIDINSGDLLNGSNVVNIGFTKTQQANGESTTSQFAVYDSKGNAVNLQLTAVLDSQTTSGSTFRYYVTSVDGVAPASATNPLGSNLNVGATTINFNTSGQVSGNSQSTVAIVRAAFGAQSPQQITFDLSTVSGISTKAAGSNLALSSQDGAAPGVLQSYVISATGVINGVFDNGLIRPLAQVALARFANPEGLVADGSTAYKEGVSSGAPQIVAPGTFGAGNLKASAVELSNTDVGQSLVDLITASTNYRGNTRVISAVNNLLSELLQLGRV